MELILPPEIPVTIVVNGHNVFNKGYRHGIRGKTYEEYYGEEVGRKKREDMRSKMKGHPFWGNRLASAKPCVAIHDGMIVGRFESCIQAAKFMDVEYTTVRRWLKKGMKQKNGYQWFYENESYKWVDLIKER